MLSQLGFGVIAKMIFSNLTKHETAKRYPFCYLDTLWQCLSLSFDRIQKAVKLQNNSHLQMAIFLHCLNVSTTPLPQWGFRQCLPFSLTTLRGKHCRHPIAVTGLVDTFRQCVKIPQLMSILTFKKFGKF